MQILLMMLAAAVGFASCYIGCKKILPSAISGTIGIVLTAAVVLWMLPTIGVFYPGVWLVIVLPAITGALIGVFLNDNPFGVALPIALGVLFVMLYFFSTSAILRSSSYHNLIGKVEKKE